MESFYKRLSYSIGNEDWRTEQKALRINPQDRVLAVTASGDRPLNLLAAGCKELVAVDANASQTALLDLKFAAINHLDYDHYVAFLGITPSKHRVDTLRKLSHALQPKSHAFWKQHLDKIQKGVIYSGFTEKWLYATSVFVRLFRKKKIDRLFAFDSIEEQAEFVRKEWMCKSWKGAFDLFFHPACTRLFFRDPGLYRYVDPSVRPSDYFYTHMNNALLRFKAKESIIISLILQGRVFEEAYSPYLTQRGLMKIQENHSRLTFKTQNLLSYLEEAPSESFDCFSLSDVASYLSLEDFERLTKSLARVAKPGARFCIRQFLSRYTLPRELSEHFERDPDLEHALEKEDRCFLYRFMVGRVKK